MTNLLVMTGLSLLVSVASAQQVERLSTIIPDKLSISGTTNQGALGKTALTGLCEDGYDLAIFTYKKFSPMNVPCSGGKELTYKSLGGRWQNLPPVLDEIESKIRGGGKVLVHCSWGVHASKYVASAALTRLCGFSGNQAAEYFKKGIPKGSLSKERIDELAAELAVLHSSGGVVSGCPKAL